MCGTLVICHSVWMTVWYTSHPYRVTITKCSIGTVVSPDDGHVVAPPPKETCREKNKHTKKNCAPSWLYLQNYTGMHGQQNIK